MTCVIGSDLERNSAAPAATARSRASSVSTLDSTITLAPAARQVRTLASIETASLSWKSRKTSSVGKAGLCTSCSQVAAESTTSKSRACWPIQLLRLSSSTS